jgi:DNA topoisomerase-3
MSAKVVLDACQSLYETYRAITYPRSDCAYLPEGHRAKASEVLSAIARVAPSLGPAISKADLTRRSKAWNDQKITAHHAIIPTPSGAAAVGAMTGAERAVYELVAARYLAQFYAPHEYLQTRLELEIAGERFVATGRQALSPGWKALSGELESEAEDAAGAQDDPDGASAAPLPKLSPGERVAISNASVIGKRTSPPRPFTDASLIAAMCAVAKYVTDPTAKKILTEADGIGTPATRAATIETLFERGYVERQKKIIVSTPTGRALIASLPKVATTPDMTAVWEAAMRAIQDGRHSLDAFLARVGAELHELVDQGRALGRIPVAEAKASHAPRPDSPKRRTRGSRPAPSSKRAPGARRRP